MRARKCPLFHNMTISVIKQPEDSQPTVSTFALEYLQTTEGLKKLLLELFATLADWFSLFRSNEKLAALSTNIKQVRLFTSLSKVPDEVVKTSGQANKVYHEKTASSLAQLFNRVCSFFVQATDVADVIGQRVYPLSNRVVQAIGLIGNGALTVTGSFDLQESIAKIQKASIPDIIAGIGAVADIATGVLNLANLTAIAVIPSWAILAFTTQNLLATIGGRLYTHLYSSSPSAS